MKMFSIIWLLFIFISCSQKTYVNQSDMVHIDLQDWKCENGRIFMIMNVHNISTRSMFLFRSNLEFPDHVITDKNNEAPSVIKSIQVTAQENDVITLLPNQEIQLTIEAKFLEYYSLKVGATYTIDLKYTDFITGSNQSCKDCFCYSDIGKFQIKYCY